MRFSAWTCGFGRAGWCGRGDVRVSAAAGARREVRRGWDARGFGGVRWGPARTCGGARRGSEGVRRGCGAEARWGATRSRCGVRRGGAVGRDRDVRRGRTGCEVRLGGDLRVGSVGCEVGSAGCEVGSGGVGGAARRGREAACGAEARRGARWGARWGSAGSRCGVRRGGAVGRDRDVRWGAAGVARRGAARSSGATRRGARCGAIRPGSAELAEEFGRRRACSACALPVPSVLPRGLGRGRL